MKTSILTMLYVAYCFVARGQENCKDEIKLTLPYGTKELTAREFNALSYLKFPELVISDHFCSKDGLVINFRTTMDDPRFKHSLEQNQKIFTSQGCGMPKPIILYSNIVIINDIRVLIIKQKKNELYITSFRSDYNNSNQFLYGLIQNKEPDHKKAQQYLEELLCPLHF